MVCPQLFVLQSIKAHLSAPRRPILTLTHQASMAPPKKKNAAHSFAPRNKKHTKANYRDTASRAITSFPVISAAYFGADNFKVAPLSTHSLCV